MRMSLKTHRAYSEIQLKENNNATQHSWVARVFTGNGKIVNIERGISDNRQAAKKAALKWLSEIEVKYRKEL